ncbi:MAG: protein kinase, partial [Myxococcaceae bacterium]|nr:protein kinase [Myxococcaceae bacterium]
MKKFTFREMGAYKLDRLWWSTVVSDAWLGTTVTGRPVVAHVRRDPWAAASGFVARYAPLARGWNGLRQPGVVPLVEVGQAGGVCWVVEEFVEGETLRALLVAATAAKVKLAPVEATAMVLQLCRGLVALDRLIPPLVHGDVSAASVMVGADGEVRLSSVGVAAAHDADATLGPARAELGGIAPEELTASAGSATDVFRLGLVWLELLTGRAVFTGATHAEVQARVQKYPGLSAKHFPGFPPAVAQVLSSMLAKAPAERPAVADLEPRLAEVFHSLGGAGDGTAPVARAFGRVFPGRAPLLKTLEGTQPLSLAPLPVATAASSPASLAVGAVSADGAVTLAKMAPKRVTADEMAALRAREAAEAAQAGAAAWLGQHEADEGNPKDVQLGAVLIGQQRLSVEHADAALRQSQAFGSTLLYSLNFLGFFDDEEGLPFQAEVLKQPYVTITQLLELDLSKNAALLSPQVAAEWMAVPLKLESGGLTVAIAEPGRLDVLEVLKRSAKVRSVKGVRATERTLVEGLKRVYEGKTTPPDWLQRPRPRAAAPAPSPEALGDLPGLDELGLPPPPGLGEPPPSDLAPPPAELTGPASVTPAPGAPGNSTSGFDLPPAMVAAAPGSSTSGFDLPPAMVAAAPGSSGFDLPPAMVAAAAGNSTSGFDLPPAMVAA